MLNCPADPDPTFQPARRTVIAITNANPAQVTTSFDHDYITGLIVRLVIPSLFGMTQIDGLTGEIVVNGTDTFLIDIDTTNFNAFSIPGTLPNNYQCPQVIPIGEDNALLTGATRNVL